MYKLWHLILLSIKNNIAMFISEYPTDWRCPICLGKKFSKIEKYHGNSKLFINKLLITCSSCTCKSIYPIISNSKLSDYNSNYWKNAQSDDEGARKCYYAQAISRIEYIKLHLKELSRLEILDIGAGQGFIFDILKLGKNGINYSAVEMDKSIYNELNQKGIKNIYSSWKDIRNRKFDLIILSHIIEHFTEPVLYLKEIKKLLKKEGCIFIEVPNRDDTHKENLEPHLLVFNEKSLKRLIKEIGMQIMDFRSVGRNIEILKKTSTILYFKKIVRKHFPVLIMLKKLIRQRIDTRKNKDKDITDLNNLFIKYKLNEYNDNGQWFRLIIKN